VNVPAQDTSLRNHSQSTAATTPLHKLLERLRSITGVELGWRGTEEHPVSGPGRGSVQVDGCYAGALTAPSEALSARALGLRAAAARSPDQPVAGGQPS
jgi:hypothetical protein